MLAHAGGFSWDEALLVMAPIALVAGLLFLANARAKKLQARSREAAGADAAGPSADPEGIGPEPTDARD
jgi:hypothetical protein